MEIDIEFAVSDLSDKSLEAIRGNLKDAGSIRVNHEASTIVVKTNQAWHLIKSRIEDTGASAALSGYSAGLAGVAVLDKGSDEIKGVVRFGVVDSGCVIDGTIDGLKTLTDYTFSLMELGNVMDGCNNLGDAYTKKSVQSDDKGCLKIKFLEKFKIEDLIGRSVLISSKSHNESENRLACGIIARSSGILQNYKKICACDGTLIWGEKS